VSYRIRRALLIRSRNLVVSFFDISFFAFEEEIVKISTLISSIFNSEASTAGWLSIIKAVQGSCYFKVKSLVFSIGKLK